VVQAGAVVENDKITVIIEIEILFANQDESVLSFVLYILSHATNKTK